MVYTDTCCEEEILTSEMFDRVYRKCRKRGMSEDDAYTEAYSYALRYLDELNAD